MNQHSGRPTRERAIQDPLAGSPWSRPETVAGFASSQPNATLMRVAERELTRCPGGSAIDIGCGAGRNAVPLAASGWKVVGLDLSLPMLEAARVRCVQAGVERRVSLAMATMDCLPGRTDSCDFLVAHGIWNLASSSAMFRGAVREAARVAKPGAALFVFTFSRSTLDADVAPVAGEPFVFTEFAGHPQCFLTREQLTSELAAAGFTLDQSLELRELNRPPSGAFRTPQAPVIYEGLFRFGAEPRRADG